MSFNIAIDGPAGAGKSTIAKRLAKELGFIYVDTGAMYRAMALYFIRNNISSTDMEKIEEMCENADITIRFIDAEQVVLLNDENVNGFIRTEEIGNMASATSVNGKIRKKLVDLQKRLAAESDVVMDGRDIGTCVLPNADVKIFLTATSKERARRRYLELKQKGVEADLKEIEKDIIDRDHRDMTREISPLKQAEDALLIDSSEMNIEQVVSCMMEIITKKRDKNHES